ncbi:MAG: BrnA antitoxin family protein [Desulforhopalus sp.]|nr:BrnA antitoxin family protein [Desulforhopalus sp.]
MAKRLPLTDNDGEVRELTKVDLKQFKPAAEVLPKKPVQIRLSPEIVSAFKATGRGWQTRINDALRDWLKDHRPD